MPQPVAKIALNSPLRSLFDYTLPEQEIEPGQRVIVSFGRRDAVGMVVSLEQDSALAQAQLKPVKKVLDDRPSLSGKLLHFLLWSANYYQHPVGEALFHALPKRLRENRALEDKEFLVWVPTQAGLETPLDSLGKATRQIEALEVLQNHPEGLGPITCQTLKLTNHVLKALEAKGLAQQRKPATDSNAQSPQKPTVLRSSPLKLTDEQHDARDQILASKISSRSFLLDGVTGSGKTEVYLQVIEQVVAQGQQALVLVPEIGLTPQTLQRFEHRFSAEIVTLHSGMTDKERYRAWYKAREGRAAIIIGTRSAIFADLPQLGIIIVDEEHDQSYKQQEGFRYSARDLAVRRAQEWQVPVVLGSATPSLESTLNAEQGRYHRLQLNERAMRSPMPTIRLLDIKNIELQGGLSHRCIQQIRQHLQEGSQTLVFINRRGYSPALICSECAWLASCPYCDARFTYHKQRQLLLCHHCNFRQAPLTECPKCLEGQMHAIGQGTEKVEEILARHFPKTPVLRIDRDSTRKKDALNENFRTIHSGEPCILVGTQMLAKGHHFPKVTLVCIIDADQGFFSADFRAMERMGQTLIQISGRAGRESSSSEVLLQTELPEHPALLTLVQDGYHAFALQLLQERAAVKYPPYGYLCLIRADAPHIENSLEFLSQLKSKLMPDTESKVKIIGPAPASMQKRAGRHRAQLLLQAESRSALQQLLKSRLSLFNELESAKKVRWSIDVDPQDTF